MKCKKHNEEYSDVGCPRCHGDGYIDCLECDGSGSDLCENWSCRNGIVECCACNDGVYLDCETCLMESMEEMEEYSF